MQGLTSAVHASVDVAMNAMARAIADDLRAGLDRRDRATLVLSGGRTAGRLLPLLFMQELAWARVDATLSDERWVPLDHPDSNEGLVRRALAGSAAFGLTLHGLYRAGLSPQEAVGPVSETLRPLMSAPWDSMFLGIGEDGHTASLFPGRDWADSADQGPPLVVEDRIVPPRISFSPGLLRAGLSTHLNVTGAAKTAMALRAVCGADPREVPAAILFASRHVASRVTVHLVIE